ncbi:MAG: Mth938-like domain-containing protein [Gammaproteobacteria bacterium]|nr:Mth938-like domain-containing protein [Gammaproteobacteria bacterium]
MSLTLDDNNANYQIRAYKPGFIQVNETTFTHSLIISATQLITDWAPQTLQELKAEHLSIIKELKPAVLLIGTGATLKFPSLDIYGELLNQGIGVEIMDTSAACRTYNALASEERNVMAALIIK